MISPTQQAIFKRLAEVCELSEDIRVGQLVAFLPGMLPGDQTPALWDVEDEDLLESLNKLHQDLSERQTNMAEQRA